MKLATLKEGGRDGTLIIVDKTLTRAVQPFDVANTLQQALDNWYNAEQKLRDLYDELNAGTAKGEFPFDPHQCAAPLPRAYQWADGSAYMNHVELVRKARGADMPASLYSDPLMYQGGSDAFLGPTEDIRLPDESMGIDFEAEVCVITDDVPMGADMTEARRHIQLVMLTNDISLRYLAVSELAKGFGFFQCKPASSFSPVAVTLDELGDAWDGGKVNLPLVTLYNNMLFGKPNAGVDMSFDFTMLIAHAARTRRLGAGTIIGSGTVSNKNRGVGSSCIVEKRILEKLEGGAEKTPFMRFGDTVRIEMADNEGNSIFGAIDQKLVYYNYASAAA